MDIAIPTVHLNGTSKGELIHQQQQVADRLREALHMLRIHGPHERDFYPQGKEAFRQASAQHQTRVSALAEVLEEVEHLMEKIDEQ